MEIMAAGETPKKESHPQVRFVISGESPQSVEIPGRKNVCAETH